MNCANGARELCGFVVNIYKRKKSPFGTLFSCSAPLVASLVRLVCIGSRKAKHFCFARLHCAVLRANLLIRKRKSEAFSLRSFRCICKPDSVEDSHLSGMIVTNHLKRFFEPYRWYDLIRPCTQVGFLPLHLEPLTAQARPASHKATQGGFLLSQKTVSVRIPRITPTGVTRYRSADFVKNKISACPDFPLALASQRLPNADMKCSK